MRTKYAIRRKDGILAGYYWNGEVYSDKGIYGAKLYESKEALRETLYEDEEIVEVEVILKIKN